MNFENKNTEIMRTMQCPFCGGTQFVEAKQSDYGAVYGESVWSGCALCHAICLDCGSVVRSYVKNPEKLLKREHRLEYKIEKKYRNRQY